MAVAGIDHIDGAQRIACWLRLLLHANFRVEVAPGLHVVEKIAAPFIEEVVVEGVLFVDGDALAQDGLANLETFDSDFNRGTGIDEKREVEFVGFGAIGALSDGYLSEQAILLQISLANPLQGTADPVGGNAITGMHVGKILNLALGVAGISPQIHFANGCRRTC